MDIEEAVELFEHEGEPVVLVAKFRSGHVGVVEGVGGTVYVTSRPQPAVYYLAQAHYAGMGLKARKVFS